MIFFDVSSQDAPREERIFSFLVVFMAFAHVYCLPGMPITFGELLIFLGIPFYLRRGMILPLDKQELGFVLWFVYMAVISMVMGIAFNAPISKYFSIARAGFYWVVIFYFGKNLFNRRIFERWMFVFSVVLSLYILVQFLVFTLTGFYIPGLINGFRISNGSENALATYQHSLSMFQYFGFIRPHGFLAEPAHASQFLFVGITTMICNKTIVLKKKLLLVVLCSVAVIITQSTTGIVLLSLAWLLFFSVEKRLSVYRLPLVFMMVTVFFYILFSGIGSNFSSVARVINIVNGSEIDGSSNVRLNNGIDLFSELPFVFKMFGTGAGLSGYVFQSLEFNDASTYMNALAGIFFNSGVVGGIIWIVSLIIMFLKSNLLGKSLVVGFFIMTLGCSIYCQPQMVWFFLLILADIKEKNEKYSRYSDV